MTEVRKTPSWTWLLVATLILFALAFQGTRGLWEPDEGRYTAIACEMVRSDDYLVPAFNDDVPHFAKPPMTYWAVAAALETFGWNQWAARLPNTLAYLATIWLTFLIAARLTPGRQWLAAGVYATFLLPYLAANVVTTDTILTACEAIAMFGFVRWWQREDRRDRTPYLMWVGFGLAFLTKGPPGMLPLLAAAAVAAMAGGRRDLARLFDVRGVAVWALLGLGWYAVIIVTQPDLFSYFVHHELIGRIATGQHHRNPEWYGGFKVYLPTLIIGSLPWTAILLWPLRHAARAGRRRWWRDLADRDPAALLIAIWILVPLVIFWLIRSRLPLYVLPVFVPLALATAHLTPPARIKRPVIVAALVAWAVLLAGVRLGAAMIDSKDNARTLSRAIQAAAVHPPAEVVFIGVRPWWGVSLYLRAEVESLALDADNETARETLREELIENEGAVLVVAPRASAAAIQAIGSTVDMTMSEVGGWRDLVFLSFEGRSDHPGGQDNPPVGDPPRPTSQGA